MEAEFKGVVQFSMTRDQAAKLRLVTTWPMATAERVGGMHKDFADDDFNADDLADVLAEIDNVLEGLGIDEYEYDDGETAHERAGKSVKLDEGGQPIGDTEAELGY